MQIPFTAIGLTESVNRLLEMEKKCSLSSCTKSFETNASNAKYCSMKCKNKKRSENVIEWRKRTKVKAIALLGDECERCGWGEHPSGLCFHHKDPSKKEFGIGSGDTVSWSRVKAEVLKCHLLCSNCHNVVHATNDPDWLHSPVPFGSTAPANKVEDYGHGTGYMYENDRCRCDDCRSWKRNYKNKIVTFSGEVRTIPD